VEGAARSASGVNLQPWNIYVVAGTVLKEVTRLATEALERKDWNEFETEYPEFPETLWEPYRSRGGAFGAQLYGALGINHEDPAARISQIKT